VFLDTLGRKAQGIKADIQRIIEERRKRKEEERRIYEEAYRKAYIKALKEKARKKARERAMAPGLGEMIIKALFSSGGTKRGKRKVPQIFTTKPQRIEWFNPPDYNALFTNPWKKKRRWW